MAGWSVGAIRTAGALEGIGLSDVQQRDAEREELVTIDEPAASAAGVNAEWNIGAIRSAGALEAGWRPTTGEGVIRRG